jgi:thymidylate synthase (FAD)
MTKISVLDHGYVRLVEHLGTDLSVVNAARVSFAKESQTFRDADIRLLQYLAKNGHTSPFRHAFLCFEVCAPLLVARQWWKYVVGSDHVMDGWNEVSRRYVTMEPEFYRPTSWRVAPENRKQGSGGAAPEASQERLQVLLEAVIAQGQAAYDEALTLGVAPEQARLLLPAYGMYTAWRWSASLQSVCHFLNQRLAHDAQDEIRQYADAVLQLTQPLFPYSVAALVTAA